jgi:hypothetical protein
MQKHLSSWWPSAAEVEDVGVEVLSPPKPAGKKQKMEDGTSKGQALEMTESKE